MPQSRFSSSPESLRHIAEEVRRLAQDGGASAAETEVSEGFGQNVTVRNGEVETIEYNRDKGVGVTVYLGTQRGHASTSDLSAKALADTVNAALAIARHTAQDECAGLADRDWLATDIPELDLHHPWDCSVEKALALARECEAAAFAVDRRINNSEGATVSTQESQFAYANSLGFIGGYPTSRHAISCAVLAEEGGAMQRDYWYASARDPALMPAVREVGRRAGERTARRLGARKLATCTAPVLFEAPIAASLLSHLVSALSGGSLYRKSSFLVDSLGSQVFPAFVQIHERPHMPKALASAPFDNEGVATVERDVVEGGVIRGYFLSSYSARKLGMRSTGNAGGNHNLILDATGEDFESLLKKMDTGLLVTELLGHGINAVTGDYSRGAMGFWVEKGEIRYPVEEITIAGNLKDMFRGLSGVSTDTEIRGSKQTGSILIDSMTIAGA
jgi:PmbA protein